MNAQCSEVFFLKQSIFKKHFRTIVCEKNSAVSNSWQQDRIGFKLASKQEQQFVCKQLTNKRVRQTERALFM